MIKAILLDLGNVIVPLDFERAYAALAHRCPYACSEIPRRIGSSELVRLYETGKIATDDFIRELSSLLDLRISSDEFSVIWNSIFLPDPILPEHFLTRLKDSYRLVLVSNTNDLHFRLIRLAFPMLRHFDEFVLSYEVGAMKPAPEIYRCAIQAAGCTANECFFADDIQVCVDGARNAGIDAVRFESFEQLKAALEIRGVRTN